MGTKRDCTCPRARHQHGTNAMYDADRCRCFLCRVAHANKQTAYRHGRGWVEKGLVDGTGTRRRLQALCAIGRTAAEIGERIGRSRDTVSKYRSGTPGGRVTLETAAAVAAAYDELWNKPVPGTDGLKARWFARQRGWLPPLAYDDETIDDPSYQPAVAEPDTTELDEVAVQRIIDGTLHIGRNSRSLERIEAIRRLAASGNEDAVIGQRIGMARDAVQRARLRAGIPAGVASNRKKAA